MSPCNLVMNPLYIFNKYSHCHQFNKQRDQENMGAGGPPKDVLEMISLNPSKIIITTSIKTKAKS